MVPDIKINDYYLQYIHNANVDVEKYSQYIEKIKTLKKDLLAYIYDNSSKLIESYNINVNDYETEWIKEKYNPDKTLYNIVKKLIIKRDNNPNRIVLIQLFNYLTIIAKEYNTNRLLELSDRCRNLTFKEYREYVKKYYDQVHNIILQGECYRYGHGIGDYVAAYWKIDPKTQTKTFINFRQTNINKKEILDRGGVLYDEQEARRCALEGIEYNGERYIEFRKDSGYVEFKFLNCKIVRNKELKYIRDNYVHNYLKGISFKELADTKVNNWSDLIHLPVDIRVKFNILFYKNPNVYVKFIRNASPYKYEYRKNYSED